MINNIKIRSVFIMPLISVILLIASICLFVHIEVSKTLKEILDKSLGILPVVDERTHKQR